MANKEIVILYTTVGCHLCDDALAVLQSVLNPEVFEIRLLDIADDDTLMEKYGVRIPVLQEPASGRELDWPFQVEDVVRFLSD